MHNGSWDDLRYVLAVAREGGVAAAARQLKVNHSTVLRHVAAFEDAHAVRLFDRRSTGYELTAHGREVLAALESVEGAVAEVERKIAGREQRLEGVLIITTTDSILQGVLAPYLPGFQARYPDIVADLRVTNMALNLSRRDADVALRPSRNPPQELVGVRVGPLGFGVYAASDYVAEHADRELDEHPWLGLGELLDKSPPAAWMRSMMSAVPVAMRADSFVTLQFAAERGLGVAILPCCIGDPSPRLAPIVSPVPELETSLWLLSHPDLRKSALVRAFMEHFGECLRADAERFAGRATH